MQLAPLLAVVVASLAPGQVQEPAEPAVVDAGSPLDLPQLVERDRRTAFTYESATRARRALDAGLLDPEQRARALFALGAARAAGELPQLQSAAADGAPEERAAALLAMAELGLDGWPALREALERPDPEVDAHAVLALVRAGGTGATPAPAMLARLAEGTGARAALARTALGGTDEALDTARGEELELRWRAAQRYGLVDGKRWQSILLDGLLADDAFLDEVILASASELDPAVLRLHLYELLQSGDRPGVLRAASSFAPAELARLCHADEWRPGSTDAWRTVLEAIDDARNEREAKELLEIAFRTQTQPEVTSLAGMLLVRAGGDLPWKWMADQITKGPPEVRARLVEACGDRRDKEIVPQLSDLLEKYPDLGLFGPGVVALARLDHPPAETVLGNFVKAPPSFERAQVLHALARVGHDARMRKPIEEALRLTDLEQDVLLELEIALGLAGELRDHEQLRRALVQSAPGPGRVRIARALLQQPESADLELLRNLFPVEDDRALNVELAHAQLRLREPGAMTLLRGALWDDSWNRSVLAGGLIAKAAGLEVLMDELDTAPRTAGDRDLRRVGFAIGEWGGLSAVEKLARERRETDPGLQGALLGALAARDTGR